MVVSFNPSDSNKNVSPKDLESLKSAGASKTKKQEGKTVLKGDEIVLSAMAKDIQIVKKHMDDISPERMEKLKELALKIERGEYKVDADQIARKMIEESDKK